MRRRKRIARLIIRQSHKKEIRYRADYRLKWESLIPQLKNYELDTVDFLSIPGDAPKDFTRDREHRPGHRARKQRVERYIAKLAQSFIPTNQSQNTC